MRVLTDGTSIATMRRQASAVPILDPAAEAELLRRIQDGEPRALQELLEAHHRLVVAFASRYARAGISDADLLAEGMLGLVEAARRFDPSRGVRFSTYATWWVRARIGRFVLSNRQIVAAPSSRAARKLLSTMRSAERALEQAKGARPSRQELASATGTTEEDVALVEAALSNRDVPVGPLDDGTSHELADERSPEDLVAEREASSLRARRVASALGVLDGRERVVVERRLLADDDEHETLASVGRVLGLSRERVRQIEANAKRKLQAALAGMAA